MSWASALAFFCIGAISAALASGEFPSGHARNKSPSAEPAADTRVGGGDGDGPTTLIVAGACAAQSELNVAFFRKGVTADGKPYYESKDSTYLYFDKQCDGKVIIGYNNGRWIFGNQPDTTAASDLDGDGTCACAGYIIANNLPLPPENATWRLNCGEWGWADVLLTIAVAPYDGWIICPAGTFCHGSGCSANYNAPTGAAILAPRDRWDPEKVSACRLSDGTNQCSFCTHH